MRTIVYALPITALIFACSKTPPPHVAETPKPTTTGATAAKPKTPSTVQNASPHIGLDDEISRLCGIQVGGPAGAPKFETDDSDLTADDTAVLTKLAQCMATGPLKGKSLDLVGRTDTRGTTEYNFPLGGRRAHAVTGYLEKLGVEKSRLSETSRGELDATGTDDASMQADRRVDIRIRM